MPGTIRKALEQLDRHHAEQRRERERLHERGAQSGVGALPQALSEQVAPERTVNLVDPDCRILMLKEGYCSPGYNAQVAVDTQSHLITAALTADRPLDSHQLFPVAQAAHQNSQGALKTVVADAGHDNNHQIAELEKVCAVHAVVGVQDPHRLGETHAQTRRRQRTRALKVERMKEPATLEGKKRMCQRKGTVEAVFGAIKHTLKFRAFLTRGRANVANEWNLVSAAYNLKRLMSLSA